MKVLVTAAMTAFLVLGCSDPGQSKAQTEPPPPPPPSTPTLTQEQAKAQAVALGVGPCDDLANIKALPIKDELGEDTQFDRMVVNFDGYRTCLINKIADQTQIQDRSQGPKRHPYTIGNLAYDVITSTGRLHYKTCLPAEISEEWEQQGAQALTTWLSQDGNPQILQACVQEQLGGT